jgi:hypothetical protein
MSKLAKVFLRCWNIEFSVSGFCGGTRPQVCLLSVPKDVCPVPIVVTSNALESGRVITAHPLVPRLLPVVGDSQIEILVIKRVVVLVVSLMGVIASESEDVSVHQDSVWTSFTHTTIADCVKTLGAFIPDRVPLPLRNFFVAVGAYLRNLALGKRNFTVRWEEWERHVATSSSDWALAGC